MKKVVAIVIFWSFFIPSAFAADIKVGFVTTLTTPAAVIGNDMKNAVNLALKHLGGKAGGFRQRRTRGCILHQRRGSYVQSFRPRRLRIREGR